VAKPRQQVLKGLGVSPGVGIGKAVCIEAKDHEVFRIPLPGNEIEEEVRRLRAAVENTRDHLETTRHKANTRLGADLAAIFEAHALLLTDQSFLDRIVERIQTERVNAEWAVTKTVEELDERFRALEAPHLSERREDLVDVSRYLLRALSGISHHELSEVGSDVVVVAQDLTPSEAIRLGRDHVVGFVIETGGRTSHTAIIARSLHIPMVAGLHGFTGLVTDEDPVVVDGGEGRVFLHPDPSLLDEYGELREKLLGERDRGIVSRDLPAVTADGVVVELLANIDLPEEIKEASDYGALGVGLYRSEFLYIEKSPELPSEEEHLALYDQILAEMEPKPVVIRTFDLGGRKLARDVLHTDEENPVLGMRGIRLTLARPGIFKTQVRALLRAAVRGNLRVMLPLVSTVEEVKAFKELLDEVTRELEAEGISYSRDFDLGIMIEVPAAVMIARALSREADFFSIGTNDLIQYSMAVDRNNDHVSHLYRPLHPAILRMINLVVEAATEAGIDVSVCGEMAADPRTAGLLVALGLRTLSLSPTAIPEVKARIREMSVQSLSGTARRCLDLATASEVEALVDSDLEMASSVRAN
jgi:phosphotransferase system enzyme I (PtsI)